MDLMRRDFKGRPCAYCSTGTAETDDHIFAAKFFLERDRANLPKAPCCLVCNGIKAKLELYLTATLPFGGRHSQAAENLLRSVPGRLAKNRKLHRQLSGTTEPAWFREGTGLYQRTSLFDFDGAKLESWLKFVGRGLAWYHWRTYLRPDDDVSVMFMSDTGSMLFQSMISNWRPAQRVQESLGNGTAQYVGVQATPPELTVWSVFMYGGIAISDDRRKSDGAVESCTMWWVITGPPELHESVARLK